MMRKRISGLILGMALLVVGSATADQIPSFFEISFPDSESRVRINDLSGSGSWSGLGATWTINDFEAEFTFHGTFFSTLYDPSFIIMWHSPGAELPLSVSITSNTDSQYRIVPLYQETLEDPDDDSMVQWFVTGDMYFGHYFPDGYQLYFSIALLDEFDPYDMTITMDWGTGVPNDETSWGAVKSLFR
jgi:hypothetical protein